MKNKYILLVIITAFAIMPVFAVVHSAPSTGNGTISGAPGTGGSTSSAASPSPAPSTGSSASSAGTTAPGTGGSTSSAASPTPSAPPTGGSTSSAASPTPSAPPTGGSTSSAGTTAPGTGDSTSSAASPTPSAPPTGGSTSSAASPTPSPSTAPGTGGSTSSASPSPSVTPTPSAPPTGGSTSSGGDAVVIVTPVTPGGGGGGGSYSSGGGSSSGGSSSSFVITNYCPLITTAMRMGANNNVIEVKNLQSFLRSTEGLNVDVTGIFDLKTENAVKAFQAKYSQDILAPWGGTTPSGILVITTQKKINELACKKAMTLNAAELATINAYKDAHSGEAVIGSNDGLDLSGQNIIGTPAPEIGADGKVVNTASVANTSVFMRFWNFLKSLF